MKTIKPTIKSFLTLFLICCVFNTNAQQLEVLIIEALSNNPEIKKFELQHQKVSEKVNEINTVSNTEFAVGYFVSEPETRTGAQQFKLSAKQMLPWFGNITARENYINSLADTKYEDIVISKRKLITAVSKAYYNLYSNKLEQQIFLENIELLKTYETLALNAVETGKSTVVDVLRLQMRQNELLELKQILEQTFNAEQSKLNNLLNRDEKTKFKMVEELKIPLTDFNSNLENLALHPELLKYDKLYQSVNQSELLNQKESNPMIGFGLDYINVQKRPDIDFSDNGKDIVMPMVAVSIPIFNKKYKSITKQNELYQQEIKYQKQERFNALNTILNKAISDQLSARISYNTQTKNLIQVKQAEEILIKNYETGSINFNDVLDVQELQLKFQLNKIKSIKSYYIQTAIINYLTN